MYTYIHLCVRVCVKECMFPWSCSSIFSVYTCKQSLRLCFYVHACIYVHVLGYEHICQPLPATGLACSPVHQSSTYLYSPFDLKLYSHSPSENWKKTSSNLHLHFFHSSSPDHVLRVVHVQGHECQEGHTSKAKKKSSPFAHVPGPLHQQRGFCCPVPSSGWPSFVNLCHKLNRGIFHLWTNPSYNCVHMQEIPSLTIKCHHFNPKMQKLVFLAVSNVSIASTDQRFVGKKGPGTPFHPMINH